MTGLSIVEREAVRPEFFSDRALELAQDIAERTSETGIVHVVNGAGRTELTPGLAAHVQEIR